MNVVIISAGLAGLCCAHTLHQAGVPFVLLEASGGVGGREAFSWTGASRFLAQKNLRKKV